jgi:phosphonoacetaldehyde hydrolase
MVHERPAYTGPLRATILDWAGTIVDYGSCAPAGVFVEVFREHGVEITLAEARVPMGSEKRAHIAALLAEPDIALRWHHKHERPYEETDVDAIYADFIPMQLETLPHYADLIPGTLEAVAEFRVRGLKIGTTTGYNREMLDLLLEEARHRGLEPDASVAADEVPEGRPAPWMALTAAMRMNTYPMESCVKVGDTVPDILEGLNAGMWTVAVARTGNELGMTETEIAGLRDTDLEPLLNRAYDRLYSAGAHFVVDSIADVPPVLDEIEERLTAGDRP